MSVTKNPTIQELLLALAAGDNVEIKKHIEKTNNYINPSAATLMLMAGFDEVTKYGTKISKAIGDYSGATEYLASLTTFNRNDFITGQKAKKIIDLIFDNTAFYQGCTTVTGDELTYPVDINAVTKENLISTLRAGTQPTTVTGKYGTIGKELFAQHSEYQINIKMMEIRNHLYDPQWDSKIEKRISIEIGNDMLRLQTNGVSDDYSSAAAGTMIGVNMYSLGIGFIYLLQTLNGSWTNSNVQSMVIGKFGNRVTPNKVEVAATGDTTTFNKTFATTLEGFVDGGMDETVSVDATSMKLLIGSAGTGGFAEHPAIESNPNTTAKLTYTITISGGTQVAYIQILNQANTVIAQTPATSATVTASTLSFNTGNNKWLKMRCWNDTDSTYVHFDNLKIVETRASFDGNDLIDYMDKLIDVCPAEYRQPGTQKFIMSIGDAVKYSRAKGSPVQIIEGVGVGVNSNAREGYRVKGIIPAHEGYEVTTNPYMSGLGESRVLGIGSTTLYGSIVFGNKKELWCYAQNKIEKYREYKSRLSAGGSGFEIGEHFWTDIQIGNSEEMCIAFYGATVETPVLMQDTKIKSTQCVSGTTTSASGFAPYCDTKDARIFMTLTSNVADIATFALAIAGVAAGDVWEVPAGTQEGTALGQSKLTAAAHSFRAFKDGYLAKSALKACTFA